MSAPTVTAVSPGSGPAGTQVVISGTGFTNDTLAVMFGAVSAGTLFAVVSDSQIVAYPPAGAGAVHVTVTTPAGTSASSSADLFTYDVYVGPPGGGGGSPPAVTSVVPSTAADNDGGDEITVSGSGFTTTIAVRFGITEDSPQGVFTVISDTQLSVTTPPGSGMVDVIVVSSYGESAVVSADQFTYPEEPAPTVTAIAPAGGYENTKVTLTGTGFSDAAAVYFGEEPAPFSIVSDSQIIAYAPDGDGDVHVTVTNLGGTSATSSADVFRYGDGGLPITTASNVQPSGFEGWSMNPVTVTMTVDPNGGYGVSRTYYTLDNGGITQYAGPFEISAPGSHLITWWSVDLMGQVEPSHTGYVNILSASAVPEGLTAVAVGTGQILVSWTPVIALTQVSYRLYTGPTSSPATLVASTTQNVITVAQPIADGGRFFAVSSVDVAGNESARSAAVGPVTAGQIDADDIANGSIAETKFASGLSVPRVVSTLPALPNAAFPAGSLVFLTTDAKLYRTANGAAGSWTNVVNANDLTGTVSAEQLANAAVTAAAIADGAVTAAKLAAAIKAIQAVEELPALPSSNYPAGALIYVPEEGALYRCEEAVDLVPVMTSNTTPSGQASASSELDASHAAWTAFDDAAGGWQSSAADGTPWTLEYEFAAARVITWYSIEGCSADLTMTPSAWTFEGSLDGSTWVVLDTQTGVTGWAAGTRQAFEAAANETSYTHYRLNVSAVSGASACGLDEMQMAGWMESAATLVTNSDVATNAAIAQSKLELSDLLATISDLQSEVATLQDATVRSGLIAMWSGAIADIPSGWYLCDGDNGTPDLRDKFVVGAGSGYAVGDAGGEANHTLVASEVPNHGHTATSGNQSADHAHSGTTGGRNAAHYHAIQYTTATGDSGSTYCFLVRPRAVSGSSSGLVGTESSDHAHSFTSGGVSANHTHSITVASTTGGGGAHENRPPYYALAFIMKGAAS